MAFPEEPPSGPGKAQEAPASTDLKTALSLYTKLIQTFKMLTLLGKAGTMCLLHLCALEGFFFFSPHKTKLISFWKSQGQSTPLCDSHQAPPLQDFPSAPSLKAEV